MNKEIPKIADEAIDRAKAILAEHFDTVDIVASVVESHETYRLSDGFGNVFARAKLMELRAEALNASFVESDDEDDYGENAGV